MTSLPGAFAMRRAKSVVYWRYTTVRNTVWGRVKASPSIALRSFGTTFQVTGTAATQYSRTWPAFGAGAAGARDVAMAVPATVATAPARAASASARGPGRRDLTA